MQFFRKVFIGVQKDYIILQVSRSCCMFLETFQNAADNQSTTQDFLCSKISILIQRYTHRNQGFKPFIFAQLDSELGFKIDLSFTYNQVQLRGILQYINGTHVKIGGIYHHLLLEKLKQLTKIKFMISPDTQTLAFQSYTKLDQNCQEALKNISEHIKSVTVNFPLIYSCLSVFGIGKKSNKKYLILIRKRLELLKNVSTTLLRFEEASENIENGQVLNAQKGKCFRYFSNIEEVSQSQTKSMSNNSTDEISNESNIRRGGYFQVEKQKCIVTQNTFNIQKSQEVLIDLAVKQLRSEQQRSQYGNSKIQRELKLVHKIKDTKHILDYWLPCYPSEQKLKQFQVNNKTQKIYIEYVQEGLDDYIYEGQRNIIESLKYSEQIISAVQALHNSGVVHRDLKPDNVLIKKQTSGQKKIKIIDFSESASFEDSFDQNKNDYLGSTIPYSPIQCHVFCEQGFNAKQIDLWSVGVIISELFIGKNPLSYSRCFGMDIYKGWRMPEQFSVFGNNRKKGGIQICEFVILLLSVQSIVIEQKKRMRLNKMSEIVKCLTNFIVQMGIK